MVCAIFVFFFILSLLFGFNANCLCSNSSPQFWTSVVHLNLHIFFMQFELAGSYLVTAKTLAKTIQNLSIAFQPYYKALNLFCSFVFEFEIVFWESCGCWFKKALVFWLKGLKRSACKLVWCFYLCSLECPLQGKIAYRLCMYCSSICTLTG